MVIAAVLLTLIVGAGAAIATHDTGSDRAHSAPAAAVHVPDVPQAA